MEIRLCIEQRDYKAIFSKAELEDKMSDLNVLYTIILIGGMRKWQ